MAFSASGLYYITFRDILDTTQLAVNLDLTSNQIALYTNTLTPNFDTDVSYSATNEVSGTGYTAGGQDVVSPVFDVSAGTLGFDLADQVWASPTSVTARGSIMYAEALATDNLIVAHTFGADFTSTAGTFTIQWGSRVFTIDLTP